MDAHWWQLPGPDRFVASAVSSLRTGRNVLLRFPLHGSCGIRDAIEAKVRANDLWRWKAFDATDLPDDTPVNLAIALQERLRCEQPSGQLPGPAALAASISDGDVVWVDQLDASRWLVWSQFLGQFQHACHARDENGRGLFCVPLAGELLIEPVSEIALAIHSWGQSVTRLDVMLYLDRLLPRSFPSRTLRLVALSVATELSGADPALAARLALIGVQLLSDPLAALLVHAAERNWDANSVERSIKHNGVLEWIDGEQRRNSAALVAAGAKEAVCRRVWQGQVRILYPFIEEQRVRLLPELEGFLRFPLETTYGIVNRAIDLEIGQLVYFLRGQRIRDQTWRQLRLLCSMRHNLAHLCPVPYDDLLSPEFRSLDARAVQ